MNNSVNGYAALSRHEMLGFVDASARIVLDIGCHTGTFGRALKAARPHVEVWGIEPHPEAASEASKGLDRVLTMYFEPSEHIPSNHFDCVVMNDSLEHMPDPWVALDLVRKALKPGGTVVISLPNLRHIDTLEHIVFEKDFEYTPVGVRDRTHLRFFTRRSAIRLFEGCGYTVERVEGISENWWSTSLRRRLAYRLFKNFMEDTKYVQFAFVLRPKALAT